MPLVGSFQLDCFVKSGAYAEHTTLITPCGCFRAFCCGLAIPNPTKGRSLSYLAGALIWLNVLVARRNKPFFFLFRITLQIPFFIAGDDSIKKPLFVSTGSRISSEQIGGKRGAMEFVTFVRKVAPM